MKVVLENTGKKFNTEWIFRNLTFTFEPGSACAISGKNGSGKSTLLQVISGKFHPTAGTVAHLIDGKAVDVNEWFRHMVICAPYLELIEEFTLDEILKFHFSFKKILPGLTQGDIKEILALHNVARKPVRLYSSGMKQRVKLALAFFSDVPLLLLDEPSTNLDASGTDWYHRLVTQYRNNRTLIVCTNLEALETGYCTQRISIEDYKV
jgi:ABC-type multidrug transport system ATPase subunit